MSSTALEISLSPVSTSLTLFYSSKTTATQCCFPLPLHSPARRYRSFPSVLLSSSSTQPISALPPACSPSVLLTSSPSCTSPLKTPSSLTSIQVNPPLPLLAQCHLPLPPNTLHFHCLQITVSSKSTQDPFQFGFVLWFRYLLQLVKAKRFFWKEHTALGRPVYVSHSKATKRQQKKVSPLQLTPHKSQLQNPFDNNVPRSIRKQQPKSHNPLLAQELEALWTAYGRRSSPQWGDT